MNILLVDNDPFFLKYAERIFVSANHNVTTAKNGLGALDAVQKFTPEFIFVDYVMPNIDGATLCRILRSNAKFDASFIVLLSAIAAEKWANLKEIGADACIAKGPMERMKDHLLEVLEDPKASAAYCASGKVIGLGDVSPRGITQELLSSRIHFRTLLRSMTEGILEVNDNHRIVFANPAAMGILGKAEHEVLGLSALGFFPPEHRNLVEAMFGKSSWDPSLPAGEKPLTLGGRHVIVRTVALNGNGNHRLVIITDITDAKEVEFQLRETNDFLNNILQSSCSVSIVSTDLDQNIVFWNKGAENLFGYTAEEVVGKKKISILYPTQDEKDLADGVRNGITETGDSQSFEVQEVRKDGRKIWMKCNVSPRHDEDGNVIGILGVGEDITASKEAAEDLREKEERYRTVVENVNAGMMIAQAGRIVYANSAVADFFGLTAEELLGHPNPFEFIHPDDRDMVIDRHFKRLQGDKVSDKYQFRVLDAKGSATWVDVANVLISWEGEPATLNFFNDITELLASREALFETEEKYKQLFNIAPAGIYEIDFRTGKLIGFNDSVCEYTGYSREELFEINVSDLLTEESQLMFIDRLDKITRGEPIGEYARYKGRKKSGEEFWMSMNARYSFEDGQVVGATVVAQDITEIKKIEDEKTKLQAQLQQAQKLEAIGTLAGGVAHDFNNLLMGILGHASLALSEMPPEDPTHEHLKSIENFVQSGAGLTKQLLGLAQGGKYDVRPTALNSLITKAADMFGRTRKEVSIECSLSEDLGAVEVDTGQIEQVLLNIFVNAWQAMDGSGHIQIATTNRSLAREEQQVFNLAPGDYVQVSISDDGRGMDRATREKIFDPFFTTRGRGKEKGTGLGLASVYGIIKNHDGAVDVESTIGVGTTVLILLPVTDKLIPAVSEEEAIVQKGKETILLVDDEELVLEVSANMMSRLGYRVLSAATGKEALEIFQENFEAVDLVLLDMILPEISGGEIFDKLKGIDPDSKIILSSGYSLDGEAKEILQRGCDGFIQKPFNMELLSKKIRSIIDS